MGGRDPLLAVLERSRALGFLGPGDVERHVAQAEAFLAAVPVPPASLLDLGSGGGVPGLILATRWEGTTVVLLDAQARRTTFLAEAVDELGLGGRVRVVVGRAEALARDSAHRQTYDVVTARSFGQPAVTAECGAGFLRPSGVLVVAEPPGAPAERWPAAGLGLLGLRDDGPVRAAGASVRRLVATEPLAERYPRRVGVPERRPLF